MPDNQLVNRFEQDVKTPLPECKMVVLINVPLRLPLEGKVCVDDGLPSINSSGVPRRISLSPGCFLSGDLHQSLVPEVLLLV